MHLGLSTVVRRLRRIPEPVPFVDASIVIVYFSAYSEPERELECGEGYISKPVQQAALVTALTGFLPGCCPGASSG